MNIFDFDYFLLIRLVAAAILGSLIGLERGRKHHEAGLRTHIVLCLGAASVMVVSECLVKEYGSGDIMRMGAQIISGVGFLGAGSIIITGNRVKGITTAAGLWTTACVGIAVGSGYYIIAAAVVVLMLLAMWGMSSFSARLEENFCKFSIKVNADGRSKLREILHMIVEKGGEIVSVKQDQERDSVLFTFEVKLQGKNSLEYLIGELTAMEEIKEFTVM